MAKRKKKHTEGFISTEIKRNKNINDDTKKTIAFLITLIIVGLFVVLLYFLNGNYVTKDLKEEETTKPTEPIIDNSQIIVNEVFDKGSDYYVLLYDPNDKVVGEMYDSLVDGYNSEDIPLYVVDLSLKMNSNHYDVNGKENPSPKDASEILVTAPTLMHIKKGKVANYTTAKLDIIEALKRKK